MIKDIVQNRTFKASLPSCIASEQKRKQDNMNHNNNNNNRNRNRNRHSNGNGDVWKKNIHINPEWKLRPGESFRSTFHQH